MEATNGIDYESLLRKELDEFLVESKTYTAYSGFFESIAEAERLLSPQAQSLNSIFKASFNQEELFQSKQPMGVYVISHSSSDKKSELIWTYIDGKYVFPEIVSPLYIWMLI